MTNDTATPQYLHALVAPLSIPGMGIGAVFLWFSLGSSLLPRSAMMQGVVSALSFAFGYLIGLLVWMLAGWVLRFFGVELKSGDIPAWLRWALVAAIGLVLATMVVIWPRWQTDQGELVGVESIGVTSGLLAVAWTTVLGGLLFFIGRSVGWLVHWTAARLGRRMPIGLARFLTACLVLVVMVGAYMFVASSGLARFANARFAPGDEATLEGVEQPSEAESSGSPDSLVPWETLGYQGRTFAGEAVSVDDLNAYYGTSEGMRTPIRVYAGLTSADSPEERAQLVVDELNRTNAQDRAVVAVVATTGTGWVDPTAAAALEYMWQGDTAIAAMQYSFLPSWISFILDTATSTESGIAINRAVIAWWSQLPEDDRPRLIAFGESLGSLGSEAAYAGAGLDESLGNVQSQVDGALWIGPTDANAVRRQFVAERDPSPVWKPEYNEGAIVRLENVPGQHDPNDPTWQTPRVVYYHHASDPVGYWNWETLWKPQEWTDKPTGPDVPDSVRWVPFTTFTQVVVDLINGFSASVGHGHNYNNAFVDGWSIVSPPDGWTETDTARLERHLDSTEILGL